MVGHHLRDEHSIAPGEVVTDRKRSGMTAIDVRGLVKSLGTGAGKVVALDDLTVAIDDNESFTLLGSSGCSNFSLRTSMRLRPAFSPYRCLLPPLFTSLTTSAVEPSGTEGKTP